MRNRWIAGLALVLLAGTPVSTQQPAPQQPVFRGGTTVVPLTVTVLDEKGAPVTDLKQTDFIVIENGKPRDIVNFFPQKFEPGPVPPPSTAVNRVRDDTIAPQTRRTFLIVLGYGRIQYPTKALDGAIDLVRNRLLPQDAVAVMAFHRTTNFTTDHELIAQLLERYKKEHERIVFEINEYLVHSRSPYGTPGGAPIPDKYLKMIDDVFMGPVDPGSKDPGLQPRDQGLQREGSGLQPADPGLHRLAIRYTADLLLGMDRAVPVVEKPWQRQETFAELKRDLRDAGNELTDAVLLGTRNKLYAGIEYLRYLDGEKHMLFLANGGLARNIDDARILARRATDARVVVDLVATNGTNRFGGGGSPAGRELAELTGGYYTSVEMAEKAVAKIDRATRFSYLLGYEPSNPTLDGRYRDVEVKVNRPGVSVRFSHGYFAAAQPEPLALNELIVKSRLETALDYDSQAKDIKLDVTAYMLPRMGIQAEARVQVTIDASQLAFGTKDGVHTGQLELQVYCADAKETIIGEFGERLDLEAPEATYAQWLQSGIRRTVRVPVIGTPKHVKVVVYDYGSDRVGSFMLTIK